ADSLVVRPISGAGLLTAQEESLFAVEWCPTPPGQVTTEQTPPCCAVLGDDPAGLAAALAGAVVLGRLEELADAADAADGADASGGADVPEAVLYTVPAGDPAPGAAWEPVVTTLDLLQSWLADERFARIRLVMVTCGAVATETGADVPDLAGAGVWGLV